MCQRSGKVALLLRDDAQVTQRPAFTVLVAQLPERPARLLKERRGLCGVTQMEGERADTEQR